MQGLDRLLRVILTDFDGTSESETAPPFFTSRRKNIDSECFNAIFIQMKDSLTKKTRIYRICCFRYLNVVLLTTILLFFCNYIEEVYASSRIEMALNSGDCKK